MTQTKAVITEERDSERAGTELGQAIAAAFGDAAPDVVIAFASAQHDYQKLLKALSECSKAKVIVGSSSAGEFAGGRRGEGNVSALALRSSDMKFRAAIGREMSEDPLGAATRVAAAFKEDTTRALPYRSALIMTDALAGHTDAFVEQLTVDTGGNYQFFGGGAGDDGRFQKTHVFFGTEPVNNAAVALEISSMKPLGIGVAHGWVPSSEGHRVTEASGTTLVSLNGTPAVDIFKDYAASTGQKFEVGDPLPFFLHNILGIKVGEDYRLRVPLGVMGDGSIGCAAAIPKGSTIHIMRTTNASAAEAGERATRSALKGLSGRKPAVALVFDCVATRLRLGTAFDAELKACADLLAPAAFVGCNTYGQIARAEGQFGGFHNCTAVVCAIPE